MHHELNNIAMCVVKCDEETADKILQLDGVLSVIPDSPLDFAGVREINPTDNEQWGLGRISDTLAISIFRHGTTGKGVDVYSIDTGVNPFHNEFLAGTGYDNPHREDISSMELPLDLGDAGQGWQLPPVAGSRVEVLAALMPPDQHPQDKYFYIAPFPQIPYHGTSCGACASGNNYGVAIDSRVFSLPIMITVASLMVGLSHVLAHHHIKKASNVKRPSVLTLSVMLRRDDGEWEEGQPDAIDAAMNALVDAGVVIFTAAGNYQRRYEKNTNLARPTAQAYNLTVGATDIQDRLANYEPSGRGSNYGSGVDLFAPGCNVRSATIPQWTVVNPGHSYNNPEFLQSDPSKSDTVNGTSFATPFAAGVAACALELIGNPVFESRREVLWFYRFFLEYYTQSWATSHHYTDADGWQEGWPVDDDGSPERILFNNYLRVETMVPITNLADLCRVVSGTNYYLTTNINARITNPTSPAHSEEATYGLGDCVTSGGSRYICIVPVTTEGAFAEQGTNWKAIAHSEDLTYAVDEFVTSGANTYYCVIPVEEADKDTFVNQLAAGHWVVAWTTASGWLEVIGPSTATVYNGIIDGRDYKITGLFCTTTTANKRGGLVSFAKDVKFKNLTIEDPDLTVQTTVTAGSAAAFVGYAYAGKVEFDNCFVNGGIVTARSCGAFVGDAIHAGIVEPEVFINQCEANCGITGTNNANSRIGGLARTGTYRLEINKSIYTGTITTANAGALAGGLAHTDSLFKITDSYFKGTLAGTGGSAGIAITNNSPAAGSIIKDCHNSGAMTTSGTKYGIANQVTHVGNSFYDETTTGAIDQSATQKKTTAQMKTPETFGPWDFRNTWTMPQRGLLIADYPTLQWQYDLMRSGIAARRVGVMDAGDVV